MEKIISEQINNLRKIGVNARLSGSYLLNETDIYSDIDLKCYTEEDPEKICINVQKHFSYVYPYFKYMNTLNHNDLMCNIKFYVKDPTDKHKLKSFDLTILPKKYESLHIGVELFRKSYPKSKWVTDYIKKKKRICNDIYVSGTIDERKKHFRELYQLKYLYFHRFISFYCQAYHLDYQLIKKHFAFEHMGGYIGNIKIR